MEKNGLLYLKKTQNQGQFSTLMNYKVVEVQEQVAQQKKSSVFQNSTRHEYRSALL